MELSGRRRNDPTRMVARRWYENVLQAAAIRCHRLPRERHGKEGVNGSSPLEGFHKNPASGDLLAKDADNVLRGSRYGACSGTPRSECCRFP
jgi:hypothetical protein